MWTSPLRYDSRMTITLRPEQEELVAQAMQRGAYSDPGEVIEKALNLLRWDEECADAEKAEIAAKIDRAMEQFASGHFYTPEQSKADMARRKTEWLRDRPH